MLSIVAIIYTSLVALAQEDMKKLIAYSSVAHMGFVTMGIFTLTHQGIEGGIFQMLSHGVVSGALFLCVGVIYDRMHTREIAAYGGLVEPHADLCRVLHGVHAGQCRLPGTGGFVGEFLTMLGAFSVNTWVAIFAATGVILSAAYMLYLYWRVDLRRAGEARRCRRITDLSRARDRDPGAARRRHDPDGHLSEADLRCDERSVANLIAAAMRAALSTAPPKLAAAARRRAMNIQTDLSSLLPELILAVGAHGAAADRACARRQAPARCPLAAPSLLIGGVGLYLVVMPAHGTALRRRVRGGRFRALRQSC